MSYTYNHRSQASTETTYSIANTHTSGTYVSDAEYAIKHFEDAADNLRKALRLKRQVKEDAILSAQNATLRICHKAEADQLRAEIASLKIRIDDLRKENEDMMLYQANQRELWADKVEAQDALYDKFLAIIKSKFSREDLLEMLTNPPENPPT